MLGDLHRGRGRVEEFRQSNGAENQHGSAQWEGWQQPHAIWLAWVISADLGEGLFQPR